MKVTIVGAGNIGTQFAVHCAEKGHAVTVYSSKPDRIQKQLYIVDEHDQITHQGTIERATHDPAEAFAQAELVFLTVPATLMKRNADLIAPYANPNMIICLAPGIGGGECAFKQCVDRGSVVCGLQRVPSVARLVEYGKTARAVGYRSELFAAAIPRSKTEACCALLEQIFDIPTTPLPCYLNITLTPSNPILHTTRLRTLFADYTPGKVYERVPLFYEEWNDDSSRLLLACDAEVQEICRHLSGFDLSYVKSLRTHYESETAQQLTRKISGIAGFQGLTSPAVPVEGGYQPDFDSRYFTADFSYGLAILVQIAEFAQLDTPQIRQTLAWYYNLVGKRNEFHFQDYGINSYADFLAFYSL